MKAIRLYFLWWCLLNLIFLVTVVTASPWKVLKTGLEFVAIPIPKHIGTKGFIHILRIDPHYFKLQLFNASKANGQPLSARQWGRQNNLVAVINAGMYQKDLRSSVGYMVTLNHINNPRVSKDKAILAFDRLLDSAPLVKIIDRQCEDFQSWRHKYSTLIQGIRMISCQGRNVWKQQAKMNSTALFAMDHQGKILFIHVKTALSGHDLINILLELPLDISRAMYSEGGSDAQLYIYTEQQEFEFIGGGFVTIVAPPIPNVIGVVKLKKDLIK